tara:strand:- start:25243 stop:25674 length:432 start_codon:yes stop_codon:yes gene_type:complete
VTDSIEFSEFFKLLEAIKEGKSKTNDLITSKIEEYKDGKNYKSFLDQIGKRFIYIGIKELFDYSKTTDLKLISNIDKERWDELAEEKEFALPQYLANAMINDVKENKLIKQISKDWSVREREVNKHIRPMAQYITEGIIEFLE